MKSRLAKSARLSCTNDARSSDAPGGTGNVRPNTTSRPIRVIHPAGRRRTSLRGTCPRTIGLRPTASTTTASAKSASSGSRARQYRASLFCQPLQQRSCRRIDGADGDRRSHTEEHQHEHENAERRPLRALERQEDSGSADPRSAVPRKSAWRRGGRRTDVRNAPMTPGNSHQRYRSSRRPGMSAARRRNRRSPADRAKKGRRW